MIPTLQRSTVALIAIILLLVVLGLASYKTNGFLFLRAGLANIGAEQFTWDYHTNAECLAKVKTKPMFCIQLGNAARITLGILGDSTANSLVPGLADRATSKDEGAINIGQGSCPPIRGMLPTSNNPDCPAIVDDAYRVILADKNIKTVILAMFTNDMGGLQFKDFPAGATTEAQMNKLMTLLDTDIQALNVAGKKVILTYDTPLSPIDAKDCLRRPIFQWLGKAKKCRVMELEIVNRHPQIELLDKHFRGRKDVCVFDQSPALFTNGYLNFWDVDDGLMIRDRHHLSVHGSKKMATLLEKSRCGEVLWK